MAEEKLREDILFLACTRPAMMGGVTMEAMACNVMGTCILFLVVGNIFYAAVGVVLHYLFKALCRIDHNMFRVLVAWVETRGRCRNIRFWSGSTVTPLKLMRRFDVRDLNCV